MGISQTILTAISLFVVVSTSHLGSSEGVDHSVNESNWAGRMIEAKQRVVSKASSTDALSCRKQYIDEVFAIKKDYPREHNFFFHYLKDGFSWFSKPGAGTLSTTVIPEMLKLLPGDIELHNEYKKMAGNSEIEWLILFLKVAKKRSIVKTLTPETKQRTAKEADAVLVEDWLYQVDNNPTDKDILNEIGWARAIAKRITKKSGQKINFSNELGKLSKLQKMVSRKSLAKDSTKINKEIYIEVRRVKRKIIFKDPAVNFNQLIFADNPLPMRWAPGSRYLKESPNSPFAYMNEWNHQSHHRNGFNAISGGRLIVLKGLHPGGKVRQLAPSKNQGDGAVLRPDISYDGKKVIFSYKAEDEMNYHIYEMNIDGSGLKQLTFGNYDDNDPIYLPDGNIMFTTTRGNTYVRCQHYSASTTLARCDADGSNIRLISQNSEPDWLPAMLSDGRVIYTRWEYSDKNIMRAQGLWTTNIDGTGTEVLWGNQSIWPDNLGSPRQIPGTSKIMFSGVGHHSVFHGSIGIIDPKKGREYPDGLQKVTADLPFTEVGDGPIKLENASKSYHKAGNFESYKNACPLSEEVFLVSAARGTNTHYYKDSQSRFSSKFSLYLMDIDGNKELIYTGAHNIFHAMPVKARKRPHLKPSMVKWPLAGKSGKEVKPGLFYSRDVYEGSGIPRGKAKYLRVIEMDYRTYSTWFSGFYNQGSMPAPQISATALDSLKIIHGTVPVHKDGSYAFFAPAGKQFFFQLLDKDFRCLQNMRSFVGLMPGETRGCVGCHERRTNAPVMKKNAMALTRKPATITPPPWGLKAFSYKKDIQPIFEKNCISCHMGEGKARKKLDLTLRPSPVERGQFCEPYLTLIGSSRYMGRSKQKNYTGGFDVSRNKHSWERDGSYMRTQKPMTFFSYTSPLLKHLKDKQHKNVKLSKTELRTLSAWIDCNTPFRNEKELRQTDDPVFEGCELIPIRPQMKNAPKIDRLSY